MVRELTTRLALWTVTVSASKSLWTDAATCIKAGVSFSSELWLDVVMACKMTCLESQAKYPAKARNDSKITVKSLNGLSTHLISSTIFPAVESSFLDSGFGAGGGAAGAAKVTLTWLAG